jgi:S1-C subfamily serine protease
MARTITDTLVKTGKVRRGQLGVIVVPPASEAARELGIKENKGVVVYAVTPGGAAERAGLKKADVITAFNGAPVSDSNAFRNLVAGTAPGTDVTLTVLRDGREQQIRASLGEFVPQREQDR